MTEKMRVGVCHGETPEKATLLADRFVEYWKESGFTLLHRIASDLQIYVYEPTLKDGFDLGDRNIKAGQSEIVILVK